MTEKIKDDVLDLTDLTTIIDDYCNKNNLDVKDALDFLLEVREEDFGEDNEDVKNGKDK